MIQGRLTLFSQSVMTSSKVRMQPRVSVMEKQRLLLLESKQVLISLVEAVRSLESHWEGRVERMEIVAAVTSWSGKSRSEQTSVMTVSQRSEVRWVEWMRSNASFLDGRGRGSDDFFDSRFGELFGFFAVNFKCPLFCFDSRERERLVPLNVLFFFFLKFFFLIFF